MTVCLLVSVMADAVPRVESKTCVRHRGRDCMDPFPWAALVYGCIALTAMLVLVIGERGHHTSLRLATRRGSLSLPSYRVHSLAII